MNQLIKLDSTLEIRTFELWQKVNEFRTAEGVNKIQHGDFLKRVEDELDDLRVSETFLHPQNKQPVRYYPLNQEQMLLVGMRESKIVRRKVLAWIKALSAPQYQIPQTLGQALQLAADQAKQLELQAPKVAFVDKYVHADKGNKTFREVCKLLEAKENAFRAFLKSEKIMHKVNGSWVAYSTHIDAKRFTTKAGVSDGGHAFNTAHFTPKGIEWIAGRWAVYQLRNK